MLVTGKKRMYKKVLVKLNMLTNLIIYPECV